MSELEDPRITATLSDDEAQDLQEPFLDNQVSYEAEYELEVPVGCPRCHQSITTIGIVRMIRSRVNFVSTLPRRGYVAVCSRCSAVLPASLTGLL